MLYCYKTPFAFLQNQVTITAVAPNRTLRQPDQMAALKYSKGNNMGIANNNIMISNNTIVPFFSLRVNWKNRFSFLFCITKTIMHAKNDQEKLNSIWGENQLQFVVCKVNSGGKIGLMSLYFPNW